MNHVVYRRHDGHVHEIWSTATDPIGHNPLTPAAGATPAAGDPMGYADTSAVGNVVVYRAVDDRIWELWWGGGSAAQAFCPHPPGAPAASGNPVGGYVAETNTKHPAYRSADGHLHDLAWVPGGGIPAWTDLTAAALAPAAADDPVFFALPGSTTSRVVYRGTDAQLHEIRWN